MTGWPWPLDAVQGFFEGMWRGITDALSTLGQWLWDKVWGGLSWLWDQIQRGLTWIWERLSEFGSWLWGQISGGLQWLWDRLQEIGAAIINAIAGGLPVIGQAIQDFINTILAPIQSGIEWLWARISEGLQAVLSPIQSGIEWLWSRITEGLQAVLSPIQSGIEWLWSRITEGLATIGGQVSGWLGQLGGQISESLGWMAGQLSTTRDMLISQIVSGGQWLYSELIKYADGVMTSIAQALDAMPRTALELLEQFIRQLAGEWQALALGHATGAGQGLPATWAGVARGLAAPAGSIDPGLSGQTTQSLIDAAQQAWWSIYVSNLVTEAATLGLIDVNLSQAFSNPNTAALLSAAQRAVMMPIETGILRPYQYLLNSAYTPNIPSPEDMIRFMVKEAWYPEKQVEMPTQFIDWMKWLGYSEAWTRLYWGAHWRLPDTGQVFTMLHRKLITPEVVDSYLKLADIEPAWRPLLRAISYELPDRIRTRWMYEWGLIDLETWRLLDEMTGLDPQWSGLMVQAELKNILRDDIAAIRAQLHRAVAEGLLSPEVYRQHLKSLGLPEPVIDARVTAAVLARDTDARLEILRALRQAYVDKKIDRNDYLESLARLGLEPEAIATLAQADEIKRLPRPLKPETIQEKIANAQERVRIAEMALQFAQEDYLAIQDQMAADLTSIQAELEKRLADIDDKIRLVQARWQFAKTAKEVAILQTELENLLAEKAQLIALYNARYAEAQHTWQSRLLNAQQKIRDAELKLAIARDRLARLTGQLSPGAAA